MKFYTKIYLCLLHILICSISKNTAEPEQEDNDEFYVVANDSIAVKNITYYINTIRNPKIAQRIEPGNDEALKNSYFRKDKPVKFIIHGWRRHINSEINKMIIDAFLKSHDVNVISADWSANVRKNYSDMAPAVPSIGKAISPFLDWLIDYGVPINDFHIIGFSLGTQIMGSAIRHVKHGKFPYVTALDPAKTYWKHSPERLNKRDAEYLEIIHTNTDTCGLTLPFGHNDFYPNGGALMPGTDNDLESHRRSYRYFSESVEKGGFVSQQCRDYQEVVERRCSNISQMFMGGIFPKIPRGVFYLTTNAHSPYSQDD